MDDNAVTASMLIRRGPAEVFDAFADPETLCRFWLDAASGPLAPGAQVEWRFKVPGISDTVTVTRFERPRRLSLRLSDGVEADLRFEFHDGDATRVAVTSTGFPEDDLLACATGAVEGFSIVLCDLKTLLETGRSANLVRDKAELITRAGAAGREHEEGNLEKPVRPEP
jgi:uncharacterized protein YndB with AHSA1/START domain